MIPKLILIILGLLILTACAPSEEAMETVAVNSLAATARYEEADNTAIAQTQTAAPTSTASKPTATRTSTPTSTYTPTSSATPTITPSPTITPTPSPTALGGGIGKIILSCSGHVPDRGIHFYDISNGQYTVAHPDYEMSEDLYERDRLLAISANRKQIAWAETINRNVVFFGKYGAKPVSISKYYYISDVNFLTKKRIPFGLPNNENFKGLGVFWFLDNKVLRMETDGTWDVDSTWKYFLYLTDLNTEISKLLQSFETPTLDGSPLQYNGLAASPDGNFIVIPYWHRSNDENIRGLYLVDVQAEFMQEIPLPGQPDVRAWSVSWHPESHHFIYNNTTTNEIFVVDISDLNISLLATGSRPKYSPDGKWILYEKEGEIHIMKPDGSENQVIDSQHDRRGIVGSSWGTNSDEIYYVDRIQSCCPALYRLRKVGLINSQVTTLMQFENEGQFNKGAQSFNWSPDRNWFIFLSWDRAPMGGYLRVDYLCDEESCIEVIPLGAENCGIIDWLGP